MLGGMGRKTGSTGLFACIKPTGSIGLLDQLVMGRFWNNIKSIFAHQLDGG
jgi:hypothetical protein